MLGVSPIQAARGVIDLAQSEQDHGLGTFNNGTKLSGVLKFPGMLKPEQRIAIRDSWASQHAGGSNAGKTAILESGVEFQQVSMTLEDPGPVFIPEQVLEDLEAIRRDGRSNMLDWPAVARIAEAMGMDRTAAWVRTHHREYSAGIFRGFAPDEKGIAACADKRD